MKLRIIALVVAVLALLVIGVVVVLTQGDDGDAGNAGPPLAPAEEREQMTPEERARALLDTQPDGEHQGRLITIDENTVTLRQVEVLRGPAAVDAAREAGALAEGQSLPGDVYVRDTFETVTLPLADTATVRIQSCANGCQEADTSVQALASGEAAPNGGGENVFVYRVAGGEVVSLVELLLP